MEDSSVHLAGQIEQISVLLEKRRVGSSMRGYWQFLMTLEN